MTDPLSSETSDQYSIRPSDMSIKEKDADNVVKKNNGMFTIAFSRLLACYYTQTFIIVQCNCWSMIMIVADKWRYQKIVFQTSNIFVSKY